MTKQQVSASASPSGYDVLIGYLHNRPDTPSTVPLHSSGHPGATLLPDLKSSALSRPLVFLRQTPSRQTWSVVVLPGFIIGLRQTTKHGHSKGQRDVRGLLFPSHALSVLIENLTVFNGPCRPHSCTYAHTHAHTCTHAHGFCLLPRSLEKENATLRQQLAQCSQDVAFLHESLVRR